MQQTLVSRLRLYIADNQKYCDIILQRLTYACNFQAHLSTAETPFSSVLSQHPPSLSTIGSPIALSPHAAIATHLVALLQNILAQLATMRIKVNVILAQQQASNKRYFDKKDRILPAFTVGQMVYVTRPPLTDLSTDSQTFPRYVKQMLGTTGPFKALEVRDSVLNTDEKGVSNTISIDRVTSDRYLHRQQLLEIEKHNALPNTCKKTDEMNSSSTRLQFIVRRQTDFSTKPDGMAMKPGMTPSNYPSNTPLHFVRRYWSHQK